MNLELPFLGQWPSRSLLFSQVGSGFLILCQVASGVGV